MTCARPFGGFFSDPSVFWRKRLFFATLRLRPLPDNRADNRRAHQQQQDRTHRQKRQGTDLRTMQDHKNSHRIVIEDEADSGLRLDKLLARDVADLSRTRIQALLEAGQITDGQGRIISNPSMKVKLGDVFDIKVPPPVSSEMKAVAMDLDIVYEDDDLLVINKPAGLTVHPAAGHADDTLVNALLAHCKGSLSGIGGVERPGIVHRIDKDTSGLLVVAKNDKSHASLARQLKAHTLKRTYNAIVWGVPRLPEGTIEGEIARSKQNRKKMALVKSGGKPATTHFRVLEAFHISRPAPGKRDTMLREPLAALVECQLETGRTHQIRVHFTHHQHPLVGDPLYGQDNALRLRSSLVKSLPEELQETIRGFNRQALHAIELVLIHPTTKEEMQFEAPLPDDFLILLEHFQLLKS